MIKLIDKFKIRLIKFNWIQKTKINKKILIILKILMQ